MSFPATPWYDRAAGDELLLHDDEKIVSGALETNKNFTYRNFREEITPSLNEIRKVVSRNRFIMVLM